MAERVAVGFFGAVALGFVCWVGMVTSALEFQCELRKRNECRSNNYLDDEGR